MGFIREKYTNGNVGLIVDFTQTQNHEDFCNTDSVEEAMKYFGVYLNEYNVLKTNSDSERAVEALEIKPEEAKEFRSQINNLLTVLTDEEAEANKILFPAWSVNTDYSVNQRIRYNNVLYRVLQNHTSQNDWTPDVAVSLFSLVINETENNSIPEWVQPDSTNPYMIGDHVIFNGVEYESLIDNNSWSPADYPAGWTEVTE